ncbi:tape measure protein [Niabella insulamsoli]|uniref:tape measure protein n=1 Tax=Niabella insulamsoli TaxID=3144874 RepID=UPI0031FD5198
MKHLEYILSLKDRMTGVLQKVTGGSNNASESIYKLQHNVEYLDNSLKKVAGVNSAGQNIHQLQKQTDAERQSVTRLNKEVDQLDNSLQRASSGGISTFKIAMGGLVAFAAAQFAMLGPQLMGGMFDGLAQRQQDIAGLETFVGNQARAVYDQINYDAIATPFETDSLLNVNRALISSGLSAVQARKDALNLANAISAVGKGDAELSNMASNLQQIKTVGKATAMDIKQFGFAGINIYELLSQSTGKSVDEVQKMEVTYQQLSDALEKAAGKGGIYEGALERQGKTMGALWNSAKEIIGKSFTDFGEKNSEFFERAISYIQRFGEKMPDLLDKLQPVFNVLGSLFFGLIDLLAIVGGWFNYLYEEIENGNPILTGFVALVVTITGTMLIYNTIMGAVKLATSLWTGAQWLLNAALAANPIGVVIALVIALAAVIGYIIYRYDGWGAAWSALVTYLEESWNLFKSSFYLTWLNIEDFFLSGIDRLKSAWYSFQSIWNKDAASAGLSALSESAKKRAEEIAKARGEVNKFQDQREIAWGKIQLKDTGIGFTEFAKKAKDKIMSSVMPETPVKTSFASDENKPGANAAAASGRAKANEAVATGGTRNTTIHINIGKQIETLTVQTVQGVKESATQIRDIIVDEMTRAIQMSQALA